MWNSSILSDAFSDTSNHLDANWQWAFRFHRRSEPNLLGTWFPDTRTAGKGPFQQRIRVTACLFFAHGCMGFMGVGCFSVYAVPVQPIPQFLVEGIKNTRSGSLASYIAKYRLYMPGLKALPWLASVWPLCRCLTKHER